MWVSLSDHYLITCSALTLRNYPPVSLSLTLLHTQTHTNTHSSFLTFTRLFSLLIFTLYAYVKNVIIQSTWEKYSSLDSSIWQKSFSFFPFSFQISITHLSLINFTHFQFNWQRYNLKCGFGLVTKLGNEIFRNEIEMIWLGWKSIWTCTKLLIFSNEMFLIIRNYILLLPS